MFGNKVNQTKTSAFFVVNCRFLLWEALWLPGCPSEFFQTGRYRPAANYDLTGNKKARRDSKFYDQKEMEKKKIPNLKRIMQVFVKMKPYIRGGALLN